MAAKPQSYRQEQFQKDSVKYDELLDQLPYYVATWLNAKAAANRKLSTRIAYARIQILCLKVQKSGTSLTISSHSFLPRTLLRSLRIFPAAGVQTATGTIMPPRRAKDALTASVPSSNSKRAINISKQTPQTALNL